MWERVSEARRERCRLCIAGRCGVEGEEQMVCLGVIGGQRCTARLHGVSCAQLTRGLAALGCFLCPDCYLRKQAPGTDPHEPPEEMRQVAEQTMPLRLSQGAEATGSSYSDFERLERDYMVSLGGFVGPVRPSDDSDVFMMFLSWLVLGAHRALSLESTFRIAGIVMTKTGRENLTKRGDVKAHYSDHVDAHGEESHPRTAVTRRMVRLLLSDIVARHCETPLVRCRTQLMLALEVMLGLRVGETLSGGDFHGLLANHLTILRRLGSDGQPTGEEFVEGMLEHSKTKHKRWVSAVGVSKGEARVPLAALLREYWRLAGFTIVHRDRAGFTEEGPDPSVVRVSLIAPSDRAGDDRSRFDHLLRVLSRSQVEEVRQWADYSRLRGGERLTADSLQKRYINVFGASSGDGRLNTVIYELVRAGFEGPDRVAVIPGPLMRASHGKRLGPSHMPLQPASTYATLHRCFDDAYQMANLHSPDPELDLRGLARPLWGHHSCRRGADTVARKDRHLTGATEVEIYLVFGWNEALHSAKMQLLYESTFDYIRRAAVTSHI